MFSELLVRSPAVVRGEFDQLRSLHLELAVDDGEEDLGRILETPGHEATQMLALFCSDAHQPHRPCPSYQSGCPGDNVHPDDEFVPWTQLKNLSIQSDSISTCKLFYICSRASNVETWRVGLDGSSEVDCDFDASQHFHPSSIAVPHLRSLDVTLLFEPEQLPTPLALGPQLESVKVNVYALQSRGYVTERRAR
jgi:hypothetical protein